MGQSLSDLQVRPSSKLDRVFDFECVWGFGSLARVLGEIDPNAQISQNNERLGQVKLSSHGPFTFGTIGYLCTH